MQRRVYDDYVTKSNIPVPQSSIQQGYQSRCAIYCMGNMEQLRCDLAL